MGIGTPGWWTPGIQTRPSLLLPQRLTAYPAP